MDELIAGGAAEKGGVLQPGDVIAAVNGRAVFTLDATLLALQSITKANIMTVTLQVRRPPEAQVEAEAARRASSAGAPLRWASAMASR